MNMRDALELTNKYAACPECGNDKVGGEQGTLIIDNNIFIRTCNCGWSIKVDKRIKVIASSTKRVGRKSEGILEVRIDDLPIHKYLPVNELKEKGVISRINQHNKAENWLNTPEGRRWALEVSHVSDF